MFFLFSLFFLAQAAILFSRAEQIEQFGRGSPKKHFYEIILKLGHWSRRRCHLKVFLFLARNYFSKFGRGSPKEHSSKTIWKSGHWFGRRCHLNVFSIFSSGRHFVLKLDHWSRSRCHLKVFLFLALAAILFCRAKQF